MTAESIMEYLIESLDNRERAYQNGVKVNKIEYTIEKKDENHSVLLTILTPVEGSKSTFENFVVVLFFHENSIRYYSRVVPLISGDKHIEALELSNKLNRDYERTRFLVSEIDNEGHEAIEMDRYYELQGGSTPEDWVFGIVDFAKILDMVYYEYHDNIMQLS